MLEVTVTFRELGPNLKTIPSLSTLALYPQQSGVFQTTNPSFYSSEWINLETPDLCFTVDEEKREFVKR